MYHYSAYGLTIQSAFELPELSTVDENSASADVVIRRDDVEPVPESVPGEGGRRVQADPDSCRLTYDSIGSFLVENGERVLFDPTGTDPLPGTVPPKVVRRLFQNEMMGILLHQQGALVLHASAVAVDGRAAIFLGPRGAGKSTTAAAFHAYGYTTLEDDVVGVRFPDGDGGDPTVVPGVPQLRLQPDAVTALGVAGTTRPESDTDSEKRYKQLEATREPVPLSACYLLAEGDEPSLAPVAPRERVFELISRTYTGGLLSRTDATADNFRHCSNVVKTASFRRLRRPKTHESLPSVVDLVTDDLRTNKSTTPAVTDSD